MQKRAISSIISLQMRKFVVKNRQKRKYVRKSEKQSLYSFSKTTYGILPILIMAVAFMATLVISTPFRDSLLHLKFTLKIPQFSFTNPLPFFLGLGDMISQLFTIGINAIISLVNSIFTFFTNFIISVSQIRINLGYQPAITLTNNDFLSISTFIAKTSVVFFQEIIHLVVSAYIFVNFVTNTLNRLLIYLLLSAIQFTISSTEIFAPEISKAALSAWQMTIQFGILLGNAIINLSLFIFHIVLLVLTTLYAWISIAVETTIHAITSVVDKIIYSIEIPFKVISNFFNQLKPYFAILDKHIGMVGKDFSTGASSLGKASTLMSPSK